MSHCPSFGLPRISQLQKNSRASLSKHEEERELKNCLPAPGLSAEEARGRREGNGTAGSCVIMGMCPQCDQAKLVSWLQSTAVAVATSH